MKPYLIILLFQSLMVSQEPMQITASDTGKIIIGTYGEGTLTGSPAVDVMADGSIYLSDGTLTGNRSIGGVNVEDLQRQVDSLNQIISEHEIQPTETKEDKLFKSVAYVVLWLLLFLALIVLLLLCFNIK